MNWHITPYLTILGLAAATAADLAVYAFRRRAVAGAAAFSGLMVCVFVWSGGYFLELANLDPGAKLFWAKTQYLGIALLPLFWLVLAFQFTRQEAWLTRKRIYALAVIPALTQFLVWSNSWHHLVWNNVAPVTSGDFVLLKWSYGPWFLFFAVYSYALVLLGFFPLVQAFVRASYLYRWQALVLIFGAAFPLALNFVYTFSLSPSPYLDLTPFAFTLTGFIFAWGLFRFRIFDLMPVARGAIFESMRDAVVVLDDQNRVLDANPAAQELLGKPARELIGSPAAEAFAPAAALVEQFRDRLEVREEITLGDGPAAREFDLTITPLYDRTKSLVGRVILCSEITARKRSEAARSRQLVELSLLQAVAAAGVEATDVDQLIEKATRLIGESLFPDNFGLLLLDEAGDCLRPHPSYRLRDEQKRNLTINLGQGISGQVAQDGLSRRIPDVTKERAYFEVDPLTRSELCVSMRVGERLLGVINAEHRQPDAFTEADERLLTTLARLLATAIDRLRAEAAERLRSGQLAALYRVSQEIAASLEPEKVYAATHRAAAQLFHVDAFVIALLDETHQEIDPVYFVDRGVVYKPPRIPAWRGLSGQVIATGSPVKIDNLDELEKTDAIHAGDPQMARSLLAVPMRLGDKVYGSLSCQSYEPRSYSQEDLQTFTTLANQAAIAIGNARLFEQLRDKVQQVELIIDTVPEGVVLLDDQKRVLLANPIAQDYLIKLANSRVGDTLSRLAENSIDVLIETATREPWHGMEIETPVHRFFEIAIQALAGNGQPAGWVLVLRDVTQEREDQIRIQMQDRLATVGQLAAGIAHDFNNILAAVVVYTDLLKRETNLPSSSRERLTIIQQQVQRASSLIRQILDFSRHSVMEQSILDLLPFVKELDTLLRRLLPENIRMELAYQPGAYLVKADPTRLQQVFMNLAVNARDAMPEGGTLRFALDRLHLRSRDHWLAEQEVLSGEWIRITVSDTGVGIPSEMIPHIFEPFFTTKPVGQGTGLGLAQAYGIIKQHGGYIDVSSKPGEGTTFSISLKALRLPEDFSDFDGSLAEVTGKGETILLVEDDPETREAMRVLLEAFNYRVISVADGLEALQVYQNCPGEIALVVSDLVMPRMGGVKLLEALRSRWADANILFITGHPIGSDEQGLLESGGVNWLQKPFSVQVFGQAIRNLLSKPAVL